MILLHKIRILIWGIVAELEYILYPWKNEQPPQDIAYKYNLDSYPDYESTYNKNFHYDWLKSHEQKLNKIEENIIQIYKEIYELKK